MDKSKGQSCQARRTREREVDRGGAVGAKGGPDEEGGGRVGGHIWEGAHPVYTPGYPAQTRLDSVPHVLFIPSVSIHTVLGFILYITMVVHELL